MQGFRAQTARRRSTAVDRPKCRKLGAEDAASSCKTILPSSMPACANGVISFDGGKEFTESRRRAEENRRVGRGTQVAHWMRVVGEWKRLLGADWDKTYAASNTIYVARQNNVLFSVLAQFFGPEAINQRLI